jgi:nucleoside-diphosphate-sugar epimerase
MTTIAVIGAAGFVGSEVCREVSSRPGLQLIPVVRQDNLADKIKTADVVIHAGNPGKRFWAQNNPEADFRESVDKTHLIRTLLSPAQKLILISSMSARTQLDTVYGRHRRACEMLVDSPQAKALIIRLGPMFGGIKSEGPLYDILKNKPVFVSAESLYGYVPVSYNARKIIDLINHTGILEVGARDGISLADIKNQLGSTSTFQGIHDTQLAINPPPDAPSACDVIAHAKSLPHPS